MAVLSAVEAEPGRWPSWWRRPGLSRPTAHRLAVALEAHGLLRRDDDGRFCLGLRLIGLGHEAAEAVPLWAAARPALAWLHEQTGESVRLFVRDGDARVCVESIESPASCARSSPSVPASRCRRYSAGKVLGRSDQPASGCRASGSARRVSRPCQRRPRSGTGGVAWPPSRSVARSSASPASPARSTAASWPTPRDRSKPRPAEVDLRSTAASRPWTGGSCPPGGGRPVRTVPGRSCGSAVSSAIRDMIRPVSDSGWDMALVGLHRGGDGAGLEPRAAVPAVPGDAPGPHGVRVDVRHRPPLGGLQA